VLGVVRRGTGQALDDGVRADLETRLGVDLSLVRIHTGGAAARSARAIGARAYTIGNDIVFGPGAYAPTTAEGRRTLAHELAHVQQQRQGPVPGTDIGGIAVSDPDDRFEQQARAIAGQVLGSPAYQVLKSPARRAGGAAPIAGRVTGVVAQRTNGGPPAPGAPSPIRYGPLTSSQFKRITELQAKQIEAFEASFKRPITREKHREYIHILDKEIDFLKEYIYGQTGVWNREEEGDPPARTDERAWQKLLKTFEGSIPVAFARATDGHIFINSAQLERQAKAQKKPYEVALWVIIQHETTHHDSLEHKGFRAPGNYIFGNETNGTNIDFDEAVTEYFATRDLDSGQLSEYRSITNYRSKSGRLWVEAVPAMLQAGLFDQETLSAVYFRGDERARDRLLSQADKIAKEL
jgi:hypothetical protein